MPTVIRAQASLKAVSNMPEDYATNSWCFTNPATGYVPGTFMTDKLALWYQSWRTYGSLLTAANGHTIKWYDLLSTAVPNNPIAETTFNLTSAPNSTLPTEVALCSSFKGTVTPGGGETQATNRGRVYAGPLGANTIVSTTARPVLAFQTTLQLATLALATYDSGEADDCVLCVWSQKLQSAIPVDSGWVDDEYDTQRRRGREATSRVTWSLP